MTRVFILNGAAHEDVEDALSAVHDWPRFSHCATSRFNRPNGTYATQTKHDDDLTKVWSKLTAAGFYPKAKCGLEDGIAIPFLVINASERNMALNH